MLAVVGDFNVDFARTNVPRTDELHKFMEFAELEASDLLFPSVQFTYESDSGKARSWVDHFLFSAEASSTVKNVVVLHSGANLSDHLPLSVVLNCHPLMSSESVSHGPPLCSGRRLAWHRASAEHIAAYQSHVGVLCEQLVIPDEVVRCSNPYCLLHRELLNSICHELVHSLLTSAEATIPHVRFKKGVAGWNDEIRPLREKSLLWNRLWRENGCPQVGVLFQLRKHAKSRYRYAVRRVLRNQDKLRHKKLADALLEDKSRNFWQEVKQFKAGKQRCSQMVDGITGDENLVKLWFSKFKDLLSSPSPDRVQQLADALNSLDLSSRDLDSLVISEDVVLNAVRS